MIPEPRLRHSFTVSVQVGPPIEMGQGRNGTRRIIPIIGGTATGEIEGEILPIGADWQTTQADGAFHLDARYPIRTGDGAIVEIVNLGSRTGPPEVMARIAAGETVDPALLKTRTSARLESGDARYAWVNNTVFVGSAMRRPTSVEIAFYAVE